MLNFAWKVTVRTPVVVITQFVTNGSTLNSICKFLISGTVPTHGWTRPMSNSDHHRPTANIFSDVLSASQPTMCKNSAIRLNLKINHFPERSQTVLRVLHEKELVGRTWFRPIVRSAVCVLTRCISASCYGRYDVLTHSLISNMRRCFASAAIVYLHVIWLTALTETRGTNSYVYFGDISTDKLSA